VRPVKLLRISVFANVVLVVALAVTLLKWLAPSPARDLLVNAPAAQTEAADPIVYVAGRGHKYHALGCRYLHGRGTAMKESDAIKSGFTACSVCGG
jgi:hypothetical protein